MILIISHPADEHAVAVLERLGGRGADALLLDTARFPRDIRMSIAHAPGGASRAAVVIDGVEQDLAAVGAVWWRRPLPFELHDELLGTDDRSFAHGECYAALRGLWSCLDAHWLNDPERDEIASRKAYQLKLAKSLGLRIPRTLITNDPAGAAAFIEAEGAAGTIYKSFSATERAWRETRLLRDEERALLDGVRFAPVIFQEHIEADIDLRVTIVGDRIFAAEIASGETAYRVDYRMTMDQAEMRSHDLPAALEAQLRAFMGALGLIYGAIDLRLTRGGDYVFLEVNPAGQWLFIEERTGQPISDAIAARLMALDRG